MADAAPYSQSIEGCLDRVIGSHGLTAAGLAPWLVRAQDAIRELEADYKARRLPLLNVPEETADLDAAAAALERLSKGARTVVFFGTGGSALGGETLAQVAGWNIPGGATVYDRERPRVRFYDNLDPLTQTGALAMMDFATTRFVVTSKSGSTAETFAQVITTLSAVKAAGLEARIPELFLGITEPDKPATTNGLRALFASFGIPMLEHHTGIGGRFSCLTNVGLVPAMARGLDAHAVRAGAAGVVRALLAAKRAEDFAPALGAATMVALSKERGIRTLVMMPYTDRLGRFAEWYVQLWAESLGKNGQGTTPVPALGPVDQHSQLQLFMDGPRELAMTIVRVACAGKGPAIDPGMAAKAGAAFMGAKTIGDVVEAQSQAIAGALAKAGRPVRTIDIPRLDAHATGALLMHFMLETIIAGHLLGIDPFDQPGVELAKVLTRERLSSR